MWNKGKEKFLGDLQQLIKKSKTLALLDKAVVTHTELVSDDTKGYKRKLRVSIRNETSRVIELDNPRWLPGKLGVDIQHPYLSRYQRAPPPVGVMRNMKQSR